MDLGPAFLISALLRSVGRGEGGEEREEEKEPWGRRENTRTREEVNVHYKVCLSVVGMPSRVCLTAWNPASKFEQEGDKVTEQTFVAALSLPSLSPSFVPSLPVVSVCFLLWKSKRRCRFQLEKKGEVKKTRRGGGWRETGMRERPLPLSTSSFPSFHPLPTIFTSEIAEGPASKGSQEGSGVWILRREARWEADRCCVCYSVQVSAQERPYNCSLFFFHFAFLSSDSS